MEKLILTVIMVLIFTGCASARFTKTGDIQAAPRPENCVFHIYTVPPTAPYKEIGLIEFSVRVQIGKKFGEKLVCAAGGTGLVLSGYTDKYGYTKGTVISTP